MVRRKQLSRRKKQTQLSHSLHPLNKGNINDAVILCAGTVDWTTGQLEIDERSLPEKRRFVERVEAWEQKVNGGSSFNHVVVYELIYS